MGNYMLLKSGKILVHSHSNENYSTMCFHILQLQLAVGCIYNSLG